MSTWKGLVLTCFYCWSDLVPSSFMFQRSLLLFFTHSCSSLSLTSVKAKARPNTIQVNFRNVYVWQVTGLSSLLKWILFCRLYTTKTTTLLLFCTSVSFFFTIQFFHVSCDILLGALISVLNKENPQKWLFIISYWQNACLHWCTLEVHCLLSYWLLIILPNTFHEVYMPIFIRYKLFVIVSLPYVVSLSPLYSFSLYQYFM